ncbi:uncharacterized protein [Onthophagus taurus]|uniref:uncharacterized protein n=1 Tax=Onthophagus taurus TaxID=166361 RepID=UPI0039BDCD08
MKNVSKVVFLLSITQLCLFQSTQAQQNLQYVASQSATILFNIMKNPIGWESTLCPGVNGKSSITRPGFGVDLLTNVVKYVEATLAIISYNQNWAKHYCQHRMSRIQKGQVAK